MGIKMIYLDYAATSLPKPDCVIKAVAEAMVSFGNSSRGAYEGSMEASRVIYETREWLAELFGAESAKQVVFTANATMALNMAIQGILRPGDHVITTQMEHNSVLRPLYFVQSQGAELTILPCDSYGRISMEELIKAFRPNTRAVVCTHVSNVTGNVNDIRAIGRLCKSLHAVFVLDASQSAGVFPIHMQKDGIDIVCFTGHKSLLGPQGVGGLCLREEIKLKPMLRGGTGMFSFDKDQPEGMPERLEAGTLNGHGIAGLHEAIAYIKSYGMEQMSREGRQRAGWFYQQLKGEPLLTFYGDLEAEERGGIISLNLGTYDSAKVSYELSERFGICTRSGIHCAPLLHQALGTKGQGAVRFSFSHQTTESQVEKAVWAVKQLLAEET